MTTRTVAACLLVVLLVVPVGALAVRGDVELSATLPDGRVVPGETTELRVQIANTASIEGTGANPQNAQRVTTARSVRARLEADGAPLTVETGRVSLGSIPDGGVGAMGVTVSVDDDAEPGTYRLPVSVRYEHTDRIDEYSGVHDDGPVRDTLYVSVRVEPEPRFRLVGAETDAPVGGSGNVTLTLRNVGSETARDAHVTVESRSSAVHVGSAGSESRFVGSWPVGGNRTVAVPATVDADARRQNHTLVTRVEYGDGATTSQSQSQSRSAPLITGVVPSPEQRFRVEAAADSLYVGERGRVTVTVVNTGPETARDAVVRLDAAEEAVVPLRSEYAVGTLEPGASARAEFPIRVTDRAEAGPHQFDVRFEYRTRGGETRASDPDPVRVRVEPDRDRFRLELRNDTLAPDESGRVVVDVTNAGETTRRNVTVSLAPAPPFTSAAPEAYVPELAPGESRPVAFELTVDEDAVESTHALGVNVTSESADGGASTRESYRLLVRVVEDPESTGTTALVAIGGLGLAIAAGLGYWWYRRR
ncbi:COG1361 S-layer family protein [Candidatus Halobonum tyrrellensis]|uniref:Sialidase-1 n=1 Tax=Candidatus Halobonum tyrrellensis G22 TaxID=1324957 RepID=V4J333_9EURY|nr:sialidase-1 [Candidatus Halobonum tyrrellensis]ESP89792.1 sialidase-1 [Candidatus Halobonum tyrrellensis G22]